MLLFKPDQIFNLVCHSANYLWCFDVCFFPLAFLREILNEGKKNLVRFSSSRWLNRVKRFPVVEMAIEVSKRNTHTTSIEAKDQLKIINIIILVKLEAIVSLFFRSIPIVFSREANMFYGGICAFSRWDREEKKIENLSVYIKEFLFKYICIWVCSVCLYKRARSDRKTDEMEWAQDKILPFFFSYGCVCVSWVFCWYIFEFRSWSILLNGKVPGRVCNRHSSRTAHIHAQRSRERMSWKKMAID